MNPCLHDLFSDPDKRMRIASGLPVAFDMIRQRMPKGNPAVGILREHALIGYFIAEFGESEVNVPDRGNVREFDLEVCGHGLSIKTVTKSHGFKILWTVDTAKVKREISVGYNPKYDILLVNIFWNEVKDSVFYIPLSVQQDVFNRVGRKAYLSSSTGTNNRGIEIRASAVGELKRHSETLRIPVNWHTNGETYPEPWSEWTDYWKNLSNKPTGKLR